MSNVFRSDKKSSGGANLQNKSVTATVAAQTVLPDSGYDGLSEVTVNPQVHTATHELVTTNHPVSNPLDLGANHNVRYIPIQVGEGTFQETELWQNSAPTASFSGQAVTLSDDITNYDYIRVYWRYSTSDTTESSELMSVSDFQQSETAEKPNMALGVRTSSPTKRGVNFASNTSVGFASAVNDVGNVVNGNVIPTKITGLSPIVVSGTKTITQNGTGIDVANYEFVDVNVPGGGSLEETLLWENQTPSSSYGENTINLSDSVQNYDYLRFEFTRGTTNPEIFSAIYTVDELDNTAQNATGEKLSSPTIYVSGTGYYTRILAKVSDTSIIFSHCKKYGTGIDTANSDTTLMPYKVFGLQLGGQDMPTLNFASPLHSFTSGNLSFTATKDCYLCGSVSHIGSGIQTVTIDGTTVIDVLGQSSNAPRNYIPPLKIKAGQVVTCSVAFADLHILDVLS